MTTPDEAQALLPVTQEDRDAAATWFITYAGETLEARCMREGTADHWPLVQAFARHRISHSLPGDVGTDHRADTANVGEALMEAIRDYSGHTFMQHWHPADCPSEIVGDLLNALDEASAPSGKSVSVEMLADIIAKEIADREIFEPGGMQAAIRRAAQQIAALTSSALSDLQRLGQEYDSASALSPICAARKGSAGANVPQDCDWPVCGCDPHADKVIAALQESGLMVSSSAETYAANMKAAGEKIGRDLTDQARAASKLRRGLPIPSALSGDAGEVEPFPGCYADLQQRRVTTLAKLGLMLSVMAGDDAPEVVGYDAAELYAEVLMALAIEDADDTDMALEEVRDHPDSDIMAVQATFEARASLPSHQGAE